ncbi:MAG: VOC family protein [Aristaeellaceae bacterium]
MSLGIGLYVKGSWEAAELYQAAFGWTLDYHVLNKDGSFFHSELMQEGEPVISVVEAAVPASGVNPVELGQTFATREALAYAFDLLSEGGRVDMAPCVLPWSPWAAQVTDRFGVRWYLTVPQHRPPEDFRPDT